MGVPSFGSRLSCAKGGNELRDAVREQAPLIIIIVVVVVVVYSALFFFHFIVLYGFLKAVDVFRCPLIIELGSAGRSKETFQQVRYSAMFRVQSWAPPRGVAHSGVALNNRKRSVMKKKPSGEKLGKHHRKRTSLFGFCLERKCVQVFFFFSSYR